MNPSGTSVLVFALGVALSACDSGHEGTRAASASAVTAPSAASAPASAGEAPAATAPSVAPNQEARLAAFRDQARELTADFQGALKKELLAALAEGGPAAAIDVCNDEAPSIAKTVAQASGVSGLSVGRTALKVRNPDNAPTSWQRAVLVDFSESFTAGKPPPEAPVEWTDVHDGKLRYMRAIPTGGLCLTCHGDELGAPVKRVLAEKYPDDEAVGFSAGQLRGAFVVTAPL
jgi:hypothetical protein